MDSESSEDGSSSEVQNECTCETCIWERENNMVIRGPNHPGRDSFDPLCVFPTRVALFPREVKLLRHICAEQAPKTPIYVCLMKKGQVLRDGRGKMYFSKEFTRQHISPKINATGTDVIVHYQKNTGRTAVRMKIGKFDKLAIMTKNWTDVLDVTQWEATHHVVMFWFRSASKRGVHLYVDKILPGAFGLDEEERWRVWEE